MYSPKSSESPILKKNQLLKDDSCLKFKMKETLMTGKTDEVDSSSNSIDSPNLKKALSSYKPKESKFCQEKKLGLKDTNKVPS